MCSLVQSTVLLLLILKSRSLPKARLHLPILCVCDPKHNRNTLPSRLKKSLEQCQYGNRVSGVPHSALWWCPVLSHSSAHLHPPCWAPSVSLQAPYFPSCVLIMHLTYDQALLPLPHTACSWKPPPTSCAHKFSLPSMLHISHMCSRRNAVDLSLPAGTPVSCRHGQVFLIVVISVLPHRISVDVTKALLHDNIL